MLNLIALTSSTTSFPTLLAINLCSFLVFFVLFVCLHRASCWCWVVMFNNSYTLFIFNLLTVLCLVMINYYWGHTLWVLRKDYKKAIGPQVIGWIKEFTRIINHSSYGMNYNKDFHNWEITWIYEFKLNVTMKKAWKGWKINSFFAVFLDCCCLI